MSKRGSVVRADHANALLTVRAQAIDALEQLGVTRGAGTQRERELEALIDTIDARLHPGRMLDRRLRVAAQQRPTFTNRPQ